MEMQIKKADIKDIDTVMKIYNEAKEFMRQSGNPDQWSMGYPGLSLVQCDIEAGNLYKVCAVDEILAVFYYSHGEDADYLKIYNGSWLSNNEYGVIHRVAVSKNAHGKGIAKLIFDYALDRSGNIKIDTHIANIPMQRALLKNGFKKCGIIYLSDGAERIAYQRCK